MPVDFCNNHIEAGIKRFIGYVKHVLSVIIDPYFLSLFGRGVAKLTPSGNAGQGSLSFSSKTGVQIFDVGWLKNLLNA